MYVDASAVIAILTFEPEKQALSAKLDRAERVYFSAIGLYEATLGVQRKKACDLATARNSVDEFVADAKAEIVAIDGTIGEIALSAHEKFGKGRHRAALNMGDCFAYACAKSRDVPLLFKGDDFIHTDIEIA